MSAATVHKIVDRAVNKSAREEERGIQALQFKGLASWIKLPSHSNSVFGALSLNATYSNAPTACLLNKTIKPGLCDGLKRLHCAGTHILATLPEQN